MIEEYVYEVRDSTDDEVYYTLGLYKTAKEAVDAVKKREPNFGCISGYQEEFERISVHERKFGWTDLDKVVFSVSRQKVFDEENDEWVWETNHTDTRSEK